MGKKVDWKIKWKTKTGTYNSTWSYDEDASPSDVEKAFEEDANNMGGASGYKVRDVEATKP